MKKKVTAPLSYDPGKGRPKEHLAYLNWQEMQQLQRLNGGNMERGPRGLPSFPPADAKGSSSKSTSSSSRGPGGGSLSAPARTAPSSGRPSSGSYGGGGRDTGGKGNVGMGKAPSSGKAASESRGGGPSSRQGRSVAVSPSRSIGGGPASRQGRSVAIAPSAAGVRSIGSAVKPSRTSVYSSMNLRGPLGPDGSPIPQVTTYATNFQTAQMMRSMYPDVAKKYTQGQIVGALEKISSALPGEADVAKYGPGPMTDLGRVSLNQIVGGFSPKKAVAALDTTGIRKKTKGLEVPGPNSLGMTENWKDKQSGLSYKNMAARSIQDALLQRNVSPEAMNASNFVAAGSKPVPGTKKIGDPVRGTQFLHDPNWGNKISSRNLSASNALRQTDKVIAQGAAPPRGPTTGYPGGRPASAMNAPPKFMTAEQKMADVKNTLYSPRALGSLYRDIGTYGITDREKRSLAQQQLLGQTIGASQYGGAVTATLNPNLTGKGTIDPFSRDVAMHWTGDNEPVERISGLGYAVTIDDRGNINYTRPFEPSGEIRRTSHMKGLNDRYIGISSQGVEPNESQLRAASALGQNWFNPSAVATTHGYEAGTRVLRGERDLPGEFRKQPAEGVALAGAFTGTPMSAGDFRPSMIAARDAVAVPAGAPAKGPSTGYPGGRPVPAESSVASVAPSQIGGAEFQPYGMTVDQEKIVKQRLGPAKIAIRTGTGLAGTAVPFAGLAGGPVAGVYEKNVEKRVNAYVAASPSERAAMEAKDPAIIGWARAIGIQPQNDYSVYQAWAEKSGLRGPEETRGEDRAVQYAGGIGALPSASTPVGTSEQTGSRPYEYYQWDVGVNIPSPGDPNYTSYQEYLRRRAQAQA